MTLQITSTYPHRLNNDGTYDAICTECLVTIASVQREEELAQFEHDHVCNPGRIQELGRGAGTSTLDCL